MSKKTATPQTSEIFIEIATEIEELAKRLAQISGIKPSEAVLLVYKVLLEEEKEDA